ncbi:hypothetical protein LZK73_34695 (plasmid) [Neorhizobium galegae]|nr:hypothetical protein LZK73_34695 [Neorhizobium galegae]
MPRPSPALPPVLDGFLHDLPQPHQHHVVDEFRRCPVAQSADVMNTVRKHLGHRQETLKVLLRATDIKTDRTRQQHFRPAGNRGVEKRRPRLAHRILMDTQRLGTDGAGIDNQLAGEIGGGEPHRASRAPRRRQAVPG